MDAIAVNNKSKQVINDYEESESAVVPEYAAVDQLNMNDIQIYTDLNLKSESDGSGPAAKSTKCRVRYALAAASLIAGVAFLVMFVIVIVMFSLRGIPQTTNSMSNSQTCKEQLDDVNKRIDFLNSSNIFISSAHSRDLFGVTPGYPSLQSTCAAILEQNSSRTSGYYFVRSPSGQLRSLYCDMRRTCGNISGGWMRVAMLDVQNCPLELKQKTFNDNITTCVVRKNNSGCTSIFYSSLDIPYSKVCGRIRAYKVGTPDGFLRLRGVQGGINGNYLDGISITVNNSTYRTHVWSLVAGRYCFNSQNNIVSNDFACEASPHCAMTELCGPLLWKSQQYGRNVSSWFKRLPFSYVIDLEVRVCRDQERSNEDWGLTILELYVQ